MIEHTIEHDFESVFVNQVAKLYKISFGTQTHINFVEIAGVITVSIALKQRIKQNTVSSKLLNMGKPVFDC